MYLIGFAEAFPESGVPSLSQIITVTSVVLSVLSLSFALSKARALLPLRPVFDYARLALQTVAVLAMASLSGVSTAPTLLLGAALLGGGLGYFQGASIEVSVDAGRVWLRRSLVGVAIWGGGLVLMQVAGLANRAGVVRLGQAIAWFSIGLTVGLLIGRQPRVGAAIRTLGTGAAAALLVVGSVGFFALSDISTASAQDDGEAQFRAEFMGNCQALGGHYTPSFGNDCDAAWPVYWAGLNGSFDFCFDQQFAGNDCQRYYDAILMAGEADLSMITCEGEYSQVPSCLGTQEEPAPDPQPQPEPDPEPDTGPVPDPDPPPGDTGEEPPPPREQPTVSSVVTEDIDPNAAPPVAEIPDEGESLQRPEEPGGSSGGSGGSASGSSGGSQGDSANGQSNGGSSSSDDQEQSSSAGSSESADLDDGQDFAAPPVEPPVEDVPSAEDTVTEGEAVQQAVAGLLAAALIGIITWAEAFQTIDALLQQAPGTAAATYGHLQQQYPDWEPSTSPSGSNSPPPATTTTPPDPPEPDPTGSGAQPSEGSTPVSTYLPQTETQAPPEGPTPEGATPGGPAPGSGPPAGSDSGPSFGDWGLGELEDGPDLEPAGAEPVEVDIDGHRTRLTDSDADGEYDTAEGDSDGDGEFDRRGRMVPGPDGTPEFVEDPPPAPEPVEPTVLGPEDGSHATLIDSDGDGVYDRYEHDEDGDGITDHTGRLERRDGDVFLVPDDPEATSGAPTEPTLATETTPPSEPAPTESNANGSATEHSTDDTEPDQDPPDPANSATPEPLGKREIEDMWRWGLERGRSIDDIREDIAGLHQARGGEGPIPDPYGIEPTPTANGDVPLTPGEAAHHGQLQRELSALESQRDEFDEQWRQLLYERKRATRHELNAEMRQMATALEVWETEGDLRARMQAERDWIRVYKMWRAGDTWATAPDGSSFYADSMSPTELTSAIRDRSEAIDRIEMSRIRAIEAARQRGNSGDRLDTLDRIQDDLLARRRALDGQIDSVQAEIDRYESFGAGRPLPDR